MAQGKIATEKNENPKALFKWAKERSGLCCNKMFIILSHVLPVITMELF